ncbi:hypothetical protein WKK05_18645 [Nostoc sp. UHCC 0302]|uniref:hypothetical protein n=1 Tax=Nostoc sp. UHCC 0302 TaxID=3134896 RepID=UPI00311CA414
MAETYRDLLVLICLGLLSWGVIRVERIYQYPFFMGSLFLSFILPQAFSLVSNPGAAITPEALERVLLVSCLCAAACWLGYEIKPNPKWLAKLNVVLDERKLFRAGFALMLQGYLFNILLARTIAASNGVLESGTSATIFIFFGNVIYIAFAIFLLQTLKRPKAINFICTVLSGYIPLQTVLIGRRQPTMTFIIFIGISLWLVHHYIPPRWAVVTSIVMITFLIPLFAELRGEFWNLVFSGKWQEILTASQRAFAGQQKGDILELRNAAFLMDATEHTGLYGYGSGWWDSIVFQYVPGQIVGFEFKKSLQFKLVTPETLKKLYGYEIPGGTTPTGVGDSFTEFGYFGCIVFGLIGYFFKHLWISAVYQKSTASRLLYMGLVSPAMVGITHGIGRFWQEAIFQVSFVCLVAYYSRTKYNYHR